MSKIDKFLDYYYFLSNFYMHPLFYKGKEYRSVEHAYQACKADNEAEHEYIRNLDTAGKAKRAGRNVKMREDWEFIKIELMFDLLKTKFRDKELAKQLLETGDDILIEGNYWHDNFWGDCTCEACKDIEGKNMLGKLLMKVRDIKRQWYELNDFPNQPFI